MRVIVARHPAPPPGQHIPVGKRVGEWVYELFITVLGADGFLVEDVLDLYQGRGAFEAVLADEDVEEDPDRWCSSTECGQELWQIACQWVWNLRLSLGQTMQGVQLRDIEWAPAKAAPAAFVAEDPPPEEYGPWQWAASFGRATGRFGAEDARLARGREAALPSRSQFVVERSARVRMPLRKLAIYLAYQTDCRPCALREQCLASGAKGDRARRVSAVRRLLPPPAPVPVERKPVLLGPVRWVDVAGRRIRRTWMVHWRRQYVEILPLADAPSFSLPPRPPRAVRSHHRWSWQDRLASNAWSGPPQQRITLAGVPAYLASN